MAVSEEDSLLAKLLTGLYVGKGLANRLASVSYQWKQGHLSSKEVRLVTKTWCNIHFCIRATKTSWWSFQSSSVIHKVNSCDVCHLSSAALILQLSVGASSVSTVTLSRQILSILYSTVVKTFDCWLNTSTPSRRMTGHLLRKSYDSKYWKYSEIYKWCRITSRNPTVQCDVCVELYSFTSLYPTDLMCNDIIYWSIFSTLTSWWQNMAVVSSSVSYQP